MLNWVIVGTNFISDAFVKEAQNFSQINIQMVIGHSLNKAKAFANKYQIKQYCTDYNQAINSKTIDVVYIATPNYLHFKQAMTALKAGKHVFLEKPFVMNSVEASELFDYAQKHNLLILENMRIYHDEAWQIIKNNLKVIAPIKEFCFNFEKVSTRYSKYLNHEYTSTFDPSLGNSALMDLGIYLLAASIYLFGYPCQEKGKSSFLKNNMESEGYINLFYPKFYGHLTYSKISTNLNPSKIIGINGEIIIDHLANPTVIYLKTKTDCTTIFSRNYTSMHKDALTSFIKLVPNPHESFLYSNYTQNCIDLAADIRLHNNI